MTEIQTIILLNSILCINVFIQAILLYICLKDRKTNKTNKILSEIEKHNLDIIHKLELIRYNTYKIKNKKK